MSATTFNLLQAAAQIVGGNRELARRLGTGEALLAAYMAGKQPLPDSLLLKAVDIILADRATSSARPGPAAAPLKAET